MKQGEYYEIITKTSLQKLERRHVMRYHSEDSKNLYFSARPLAGTQTIPKDWVIQLTKIEGRPKIVLQQVLR